MTPETWIDTFLRAALRRHAFCEVVVAVSGGSDSLALFHITADWARFAGVGVRAVTIDHGLRPESASEAAGVAEACAQLGVRHDILRWDGWDGQGNLSEAARHARYRLLAESLVDVENSVILLGHTRDDVAETFLMRLARGSGVDGLAQMQDDFTRHGVRFLRPMLPLARADLRDWLSGRSISWFDDPSNEDPRFDRARARKALETLADLGLTTERLADTATRMGHARHALEVASQRAAAGTAWIEAGDVVFDRARLASLEREIADRLMAHALMWVSGAAHRPRLAALTTLFEAEIEVRARTTLSGCLITYTPDRIRVSREFNAVKDHQVGSERLWDNRWRMFGPHRGGFVIRALGEAGLRQCPDWRATGCARETLVSGPALFDNRDDRLLAAPLAGLDNGWSVELRPKRGDFFSSILSH